uniref:FLYWCH-type domain-containing protein n=1 Tax=Ditylenchus dipsaci TaxID=166011 RepID=A0A915D7L2_9BILA
MESDSDRDVNVFGDSSEEEVSATIRASSERIPTKVVNDAVVRFVCLPVADVCDRNEALLYTEVIYRCQKTKCQKRVWTNVAAECDKQNYSRETVVEHNHQEEPIKMEVLVIVDKTTNRDIIAAALEGAIDEVRLAVNTKSLGHRLTLFKQKDGLSTQMVLNSSSLTRAQQKIVA